MFIDITYIHVIWGLFFKKKREKIEGKGEGKKKEAKKKGGKGEEKMKR